MKILIVDDSKAMRMIVRRALRMAMAGCEHAVIEASNGLEALKLLESNPVDLILTDWHMPEMNGPQLLQKLQELGKKVRLGFVTSDCSTEAHQAAQEAGALFVITKPFTPENFQRVLGPILN
jgi:two-component system chemotaxis response regulator CheY